MTNLDQIIRDATARGTVTTVSRLTEDMAEEWAREVLKDPAVKAEFIKLARQAFTETLAALNQPVPPTP